MNDWATKEDVSIIRSSEGQTQVRDCDGHLLFRVPSKWSDDDIWTCLRIANYGHQAGVEKGKIEIQNGLRKLLDIGGSIGAEIDAHEARVHGIGRDY